MDSTQCSGSKYDNNRKNNFFRHTYILYVAHLFLNRKTVIYKYNEQEDKN